MQPILNQPSEVRPESHPWKYKDGVYPGPIVPPPAAPAGLYRLSVDQWHRMIDTAVLTKYDKTELLDGYMVNRVRKSPRFCSTVERLYDLFSPIKAKGFAFKLYGALTLKESEAEPQMAFVRQRRADVFEKRFPNAEETEIVIHVSDESLEFDRTVRKAIYEREGLREYWIVDVVGWQVEMYQLAKAKPKYKTLKVYKEGQKVPVVLGGVKRGEIAVDDILPKAG